jgi:hypothetical protein
MRLSSSFQLKKNQNFYLLTGSESPLFKFFLVPVHLELELVQLFISFKNKILLVIEGFLLFDGLFFQFSEFSLDTAYLTFRHLFKMVFCLDFLVLGLDQLLGVV